MTMKTTSYGKLYVIVMLCKQQMTLSYHRILYNIKYILILNRKIVPKENFCKDVIVWAPKNAWMTSELMEDWLGCVWERQPGVLSKTWCMLVMDAFCDHLSGRIINRLRNKNTNLVIMPSGMTS
jgi:hypothetical protein